jgi:single-strand DNA-binding protein
MPVYACADRIGSDTDARAWETRMQDAQITLTGNLGNDPELRFTGGGIPVVTFSVGCTERRQVNGEWTDGKTSWWRITAWRALAENAAASLRTGDRVIVVGTIVQTSWTDRETSETRYGTEVRADELGLSVKFAPASSKRAERGTGEPVSV